MYLAIVCLISVGIGQACAEASTINEQGLILNSKCSDDNDCAIDDEKFPKVTLQCVDKTCKCSYQGGFVPDFLYLEPENKKCLMSKYGRCGKGLKQPDLEVGCSGGFKCLVDQRCRDPADQDKVHDRVFSFKIDEKTTECNFSSKLQLKLEDKSCVCKILSPVPENRIWNMLNYEGGNFCSVSKLGPCGRNDDLEIEIGCHGAGIKCEDRICTDPAHPKSRDGEPCSEIEHCAEGITCNLNTKKCVTLHSKKNGEPCSVTEECVKESICNLNLKICITRNSIKKGEACTVVDGKDECEQGHVCTKKRLKSEKDKDRKKEPKCRNKTALDDPEELCRNKCFKNQVCNINTKRCVAAWGQFSKGQICSITTNTEKLKRICKHGLECLQSKKHKEGTLTCQDTNPKRSSASLILFTIGIFKLNILIPLILTVVIPIINF